MGFLSGLLLLLLVLALIGISPLPGKLASTCAEVRGDIRPPGSANGNADTLYVFLHGMNPRQERLEMVGHELLRHGSALVLTYDASPASNADPEAIAANVADKIGRESQPFKKVVLVAHSMGAALMRRALLDARQEAWVEKVDRLVLMSGISRGWDLAGDRAPDASVWHWWTMRAQYWLGKLVGVGRLISSFERGTPFIANLRLEWMQWMQSRAPGTGFPVVLLLGDIDELVRREDNEDLRVMSAGSFSLLRVRGTGHGEILDFSDDSGEPLKLGEYRRRKLETALTTGLGQLGALSEELPAATNPTIAEVVFVLHGIRDLGRWSANFEQALVARDPQRLSHRVIVSPRYGYFGMGPFLFKEVRQRHVRWLMDVYTETLARYPNVKPQGIKFFGHSNGTYLLAKALEDYRAMKLDRIVFAGSVVPKAYDWGARGGQVKRVRNYVGTDDWVVALFPRLFELWPFSLFDNDLGSAGFNGFDREGKTAQDGPEVENVRFVAGEHSAFESRVSEIVEFMTSDTPAAAREERRTTSGKLLGWAVVVLLVWTLLAASLVFVTIRVVSASPSPAWPVLLLFGLLVLRVLQTV